MIRKTSKYFNRGTNLIAKDGSKIDIREHGITETWWLFWIIPIYSRETLQ